MSDKFNYEPTLNFIDATVEKAYNQEVNALVTNIKRAVTRKSNDIFQMMALKGVDVSQAPALGAFTPTWVALKTGSNFYFRTGTLKRELMSTSVKDKLGRTDVEITQTGFGKNITQRYENWKNKNVTSPVFRNSKGQFVSSKNIKRTSSLKTTISVDPFPLIDTTKDLEKQLFSGDTYHKLTNYKGKRQRPLVEPFIKYYTSTILVDTVNKAAS